MTRHVFYFGPLRFTATKRSRSRHPEPTPFARLSKDLRMAGNFKSPKITMCLEILHKPCRRQDQNDKARERVNT